MNYPIIMPPHRRKPRRRLSAFGLLLVAYGLLLVAYGIILAAILFTVLFPVLD